MLPTTPVTAGGGRTVHYMGSVTDGHDVSDAVALKQEWELLQNADLGPCTQGSDSGSPGSEARMCNLSRWF